MKKVLFCAGLVALATSCTQDDVLSLDVQNESRGITFEMAEPVESRVQYEKDEDGSWAPFWYAEQDRISIFATGVNIGYPTVKKTKAEGYWREFAANDTVAQYKATKSKKSAEFTSVSDDEMLTFNNNKNTSKFLAVYPYNVNYTLDQTTDGDTLKIGGGLTGLAAQTIASAKGQNNEIVQWAYAAVSGQESYESVGEKVKLQYRFATPVIKFGTKGLDQAYQTAFGKLKTISFTTLGYTHPTEASKNIAASKLTYSDATIEVDTLTWNHKLEGTTTGTNIQVTIGKAWSDEALAPIAIANVDRSAFVAKGVKEKYTADFVFDYIDLRAGGVAGKTTDKSWTPSANFYAVTLDMADFNYLVTKSYETTGANPVTVGRTLFVINGDFSDILTEDGLAINWDDSQTTGAAPVAFTEIETVVVEEGVVLDAEDFKVLNKLTNVKSLTLKGNTSIPAEALKSLTSLKVLNLPKVTTVGATSFDAELEEVYMPSYKFSESTAINEMLLNAGSLKKLNMGAETMNAGFPKNGLLLTGFDKLTEVTVKDGITIGANAFKGCTVLAKVNGRVDIVGTNAFADCPALTSIIISNADVVDGSFDGCSTLAKVYLNNATTALKPNYVGSKAFAGTAVNLDLSETTMIADSAFHNAGSMVGYDYKGQKVVKVGAETIGKGAFDGATKIGFIYFMNATEIADDILKATTKLEEIKFGKAFVYTDATATPSANTFGSSTDVKLFVVEGQTGVAGNTLTLNPGTTKKRVFKFSQIAYEGVE